MGITCFWMSSQLLKAGLVALLCTVHLTCVPFGFPLIFQGWIFSCSGMTYMSFIVWKHIRKASYFWMFSQCPICLAVHKIIYLMKSTSFIQCSADGSCSQKEKLTVHRSQFAVHRSTFIQGCAKYRRTRTTCVHFTWAFGTAVCSFTLHHGINVNIVNLKNMNFC